MRSLRLFPSPGNRFFPPAFASLLHSGSRIATNHKATISWPLSLTWSVGGSSLAMVQGPIFFGAKTQSWCNIHLEVSGISQPFVQKKMPNVILVKLPLSMGRFGCSVLQVKLQGGWNPDNSKSIAYSNHYQNMCSNHHTGPSFYSLKLALDNLMGICCCSPFTVSVFPSYLSGLYQSDVSPRSGSDALKVCWSDVSKWKFGLFP